MNRARKVQRFLSQPFHVAEVFTGAPGKLRLGRRHRAQLQGDHRGQARFGIPEQAFYMKGAIEEVLEAAKTMQGK